MTTTPSNLTDRQRVSRHDLLFDTVPGTYFEGFIVGNGDLGAVLWFEEDRMVLSLDKADIWERRADQSIPDGMDFQTALRQARDGSFDPTCRLFDPVRPTDRVWGNKLPIGRVEWQLPQPPHALRGTLRLYDAGFSLEAQLDAGTLKATGYLHAKENVVVLDLEVSGDLVLPPPAAARRLDERSREIMQIWQYDEPQYGGADESTWFTQSYSGDEQYVVLATTLESLPNRGRYAATVARGAAAEDLTDQAEKYVRATVARSDLSGEHESWWSDYWTGSHIAIPDAALERLWYAEMYKLGCQARSDGLPLSIMGVWNPDYRIPPCYGDLHHNLETEMNYWPIFPANRLEQAAPLYDMMIRELPRFEQNCREFFGWSGAYLPGNMDIYGQGVGFLWYPWNLQVGVGAWLAQHFWLHYLYSADADFLRDKAWPFMEAVGRFWLGFLEEEEDGFLHVPWSYSPEYDDIVRKGKDSAFDLSLVRYLFTILIDAAGRLDRSDEAQPYRDALDKLLPLPADSTGIQVYAGNPLDHSHRHFSHLMAIHPLGFLNIEGDDADRELIDRSLDHLRHIGMGHWSGWSFAWAALLAGRTGRRGMAHAMLRFYTDQVILNNTLQVSVDWRHTGFYTAEHGFINTMEAGTGAAAGIMELLLQSWGEKIRIFPCVPESWEEAAFSSLRTEGAFIVSATMEDGVTAGVRLLSEAGNECVVQNPWPGATVTLRDGSGREQSLQGEILRFATQPGGEYELTCADELSRRSLSTGTFSGLPRWD